MGRFDPQPTKFIESNALLAIQTGDSDEAYRLVLQLLPGERRKLAEAAEKLQNLCAVAGDQDAVG